MPSRKHDILESDNRDQDHWFFGNSRVDIFKLDITKYSKQNTIINFKVILIWETKSVIFDETSYYFQNIVFVLYFIVLVVVSFTLYTFIHTDLKDW